MSQNQNATRAEFTYDARNRCVLRKYYSKGSQGQWILNQDDSRAITYDAAWNLLSERKLNGQQVAEYIFGSRTDEILSAQLGSRAYYPLVDGLGSTLALTDKNGKVAERYRTTAYGAPTVLKANYQPQTTASATGYRFIFTGREWLSSVQLNDHRNRYYSPEQGRWLSTDPINFWGGRNLYGYVGNNPANVTDLNGLLPSEGQPCCLQHRSTWEVTGFSSLGACVNDWTANNGSTGWWGALIGGGTGVVAIWNPLVGIPGLGLGTYEGGLAAEGYLVCSALQCIQQG